MERKRRPGVGGALGAALAAGMIVPQAVLAKPWLAPSEFPRLNATEDLRELYGAYAPSSERTPAMAAAAFPLPCSFGGSGVETGSGRLMLAHAILVKSEPEREATVPAPPEKIELWFNEGVGREYAALAVIDSTGARVDDKNARLGFFDKSYLRVTLPPINPGTYTVRFRVQSADGHIISGKFNFAVQGP